MASGNRQPPRGCAPNAGPGKRDWRTPIPHLSLPGRKAGRGLNVFGLETFNVEQLTFNRFDRRTSSLGTAADGDLDASQPPDILATTRNLVVKWKNTTILGTDPFTTCLRMKFRTSVLLCASILVGCDKRVELSSETLRGTYIGTYENGRTEIFVIKSDGTFSQSLSQSNNVLYTNQGRWEIDTQTNTFLRTITFRNVYLAVDVWNLNKGKPRKVDWFHAFWSPHGPGITFSDEEHFWVDKQPGNPGKKP